MKNKRPYLMEVLSDKDLEKKDEDLTYMRMNQKEKAELLINSFNPQYNARMLRRADYNSLFIYELRTSRRINKEDKNKLKYKLLKDYKILLNEARFTLLKDTVGIEKLLKKLKVLKE